MASATDWRCDEPAAWLIWSGEHKAWWRPEAKGYVEFVGGAGRYTRSEARAWLEHAGPEKKLEIVPDPYGPFAEGDPAERQTPTPGAA